MIEQCHICGSTNIKKYDSYGYTCNFCDYDNLYNRIEHSYSKEDIFNKRVHINIKYKKDNYRYIYLNGKALRKYSSIDLETMRIDYQLISYMKNEFVENTISFEDFIKFISVEYNQFGVKFYDRQQSEMANGINERKKLISRLPIKPSDSDKYLTISVDMIKSSASLNELEKNIDDVSELNQFLNREFLECLKKSFYKKLTGDGFLALYSLDSSFDFMRLIFEIEKIEKKAINYISKKNLNIENNSVRFGVGLDISKVIIMYGIEDSQTGLAINRATKLSKIHSRDRYSKGEAITTLRFVKHIQQWIDISNNKEDKYDNADVYYMEKEDIEKLCEILTTI